MRLASGSSGGSTNRHGLTSTVPPAIPNARERLACTSYADDRMASTLRTWDGALPAAIIAAMPSSMCSGRSLSARWPPQRGKMSLRHLDQ